MFAGDWEERSLLLFGKSCVEMRGQVDNWYTRVLKEMKKRRRKRHSCSWVAVVIAVLFTAVVNRLC